jgi:hypothetical protein
VEGWSSRRSPALGEGPDALLPEAPAPSAYAATPNCLFHRWSCRESNYAAEWGVSPTPDHCASRIPTNPTCDRGTKDARLTGDTEYPYFSGASFISCPSQAQGIAATPARRLQCPERWLPQQQHEFRGRLGQSIAVRSHSHAEGRAPSARGSPYPLHHSQRRTHSKTYVVAARQAENCLPLRALRNQTWSIRRISGSPRAMSAARISLRSVPSKLQKWSWLRCSTPRKTMRLAPHGVCQVCRAEGHITSCEKDRFTLQSPR